jgi:hypothetical protein
MGDPVIGDEEPGCTGSPSGQESSPFTGIGKAHKKGNEGYERQYPHARTREGKYKEDRGCEDPQEKTRLHKRAKLPPLQC